MDAQEKYEYWLDIAQYDLDTAEAKATLSQTKDVFEWLLTLKP
jgi:hypothetical protein